MNFVCFFFFLRGWVGGGDFRVKISNKQNLSLVLDADRGIPTEGKRIMPETKFTKFPALSIYPLVGISRSASETDD